MSAAKKKQISETLKRRWAERKARSVNLAPIKQQGKPHRIAFDGVETNSKVEFVPADNGRERVAADVVALLNDEISNLLLVRVVERILRP